MIRQKVITGNWKMNGTQREAERLIGDLLPLLDRRNLTEVVVCPPYTALTTVGLLLEGSGVALGAQDMFWKERGAYTGQISPLMLTELGCRYVIVGHSEPRGRFGVPEPDFDADILAYFGDNDIAINRKLRAALAAGLTPICCVGETLSERQSGDTDSVGVGGQSLIALRGVTEEQVPNLLFAYEPVWAIGTGEVCAPQEADRVCGVVRDTVQQLYGHAAGQAVRVLYGGSVRPDNATEILAKENIDGALVGGASLKAVDFAAIIAAASSED